MPDRDWPGAHEALGLFLGRVMRIGFVSWRADWVPSLGWLDLAPAEGVAMDFKAFGKQAHDAFRANDRDGPIRMQNLKRSAKT